MPNIPASLPFSWPAAVCVSFFGLGSWVVINGIWVGLPLIVNTLPEGWNLPAYLSILIQIANLGPILYVFLTKYCRTRSSSSNRCAKLIQPPERLANYAILLIGLLSCILLAHFWDVKAAIPTYAGKSNHSVGLLTLATCAAIVDCTSTVTNVAYLTGVSELYVGALNFGEAFSDLLPSTVALIQGVGDATKCVNKTVNGTTIIEPVYSEPRFGVMEFMYCMAILLAISLVAFSLLDLSPWGLGRVVHQRYLQSMHRSEYDNVRVDVDPGWSIEPPGEAEGLHQTRSTVTDLSTQNALAKSSLSVFVPHRNPSDSDHPVPLVIAVRPSSTSLSSSASSSSKHVIRRPWIGIDIFSFDFFLPVALMSYSTLLTNGFLPAFQTYSSASYNQLTYHFSVTLSGVICALFTLLTTYLVYREKTRLIELSDEKLTMIPNAADAKERALAYVRRSQYLWIGITLVSSIPTAYVIYLASMSPNPPQLGGFGPALAVISWISIRSGFSGLRTWLWLHLSSRSHDPMVLRYAGLASQLGSAMGAVLSFILVVHLQLFTRKEPCQ